MLRPRGTHPHLRNSALGGGTTLTGRTPRTFLDAGFWEIAVDQIKINDRPTAAAYRAMVARLRQGEDIVVPINDPFRPLGWRAANAAAVLAVAAPLRATTLNLTVAGMDVQPGHYLAIGDRLHLITGLIEPVPPPPLNNQVALDTPWSDAAPFADTVGASASYLVSIAPPLRQAVNALTAVDFKAPRLLCTVKDPSDGDLELDLKRGFPSLTFIETI